VWHRAASCPEFPFPHRHYQRSSAKHPILDWLRYDMSILEGRPYADVLLCVALSGLSKKAVCGSFTKYVFVVDRSIVISTGMMVRGPCSAWARRSMTSHHLPTFIGSVHLNQSFSLSTNRRRLFHFLSKTSPVLDSAQVLPEWPWDPTKRRGTPSIPISMLTT
jgi:hypothetical protein